MSRPPAAVGPDNLLYVLELSDNAGYPALGNGKVLRIEHSGAITEVITGLNVPGGMAWVALKRRPRPGLRLQR